VCCFRVVATFIPVFRLSIPVGHGHFSSLRSMLTLVMALATTLGGLVVLGAGGTSIGGISHIEAKGQDGAALIAERIEDALHAVGRDLGFAGDSLALHAPEALGEAADHLFAAWRRLHPEHANILLADRTGRILAASSPRIVGADVSGSPWFARSRVGAVIGEATDESRAGVAVPRNLIVAAPAGSDRAAVGILAVQLPPNWIDRVVAAARRSLPDAGRGFSIQVMNGAGRSLHRSGPEVRGPDASATVGDVRRGGVGWLVSVRMPEAPVPGMPFLTLLGTVTIMTVLGWMLGGQLTRGLAHAGALCRQEAERKRAVWCLTRDLHDLTAQIRSAMDRSLSRERLLQEKRTALVRSRDRIRAIRALTGASCWEIDLAAGQVVWTDGEEAVVGAAPERVCALGDVLAHLEPEDRAAIDRALETVQADRGAVRDVIVRTRAGNERISGRRLAFRIAAGGVGSGRIYALSREYREPLLATFAEPRAAAERGHPSGARTLIDGVALGRETSNAQEGARRVA
jgi:hypothetical protein